MRRRINPGRFAGIPFLRAENEGGARQPLTNVASFEDYVPEIERRDSLAYATVIGLALRQRIN